MNPTQSRPLPVPPARLPFAWRLVTLVAGALLLLATSGQAQVENVAVGVAVKIYAHNPAGTANLSGTFLGSSPGANDGYASAAGETAILGSQGYVRLEPGKSYTVSAGGGGWETRELNVVAPPGYRVVMNNFIRTRMTYTNTANVVIQLLPLGARHPGLAGMATSVAANEIEWRVSLGNLRNGASAGDLEMVDTGMGVTWFGVFTPGALFHEEVSDEVSVYRPNNIIRQIIANQVVVDVVPLTTASYEIRCYHPNQMLGSTNPRAFSGKPYALYRIEQGATATALKFTKEIRDITATDLNAPVSRREIMTLARSGTWPAYTWTRTDWTLENQTPLAETVVQSAGPAANRTESVTVRVPGPGAVALKLARTYTVPQHNNQSTIGEVLAGETAGTGTGLTASFAYYNNPAQFGSLGYLKSAVQPGGTWVAYDYYDADLPAGIRGGRVKYRYRPYLNAPATVSQVQGQGEITYYEYVNDVFGAPVRPSLVETRVNGTLVAKSTTTYNDSYGNANGFPLTQSAGTGFADATAGLVTTVRGYRADTSDAFVRGQSHAIAGPDGVKQVFAYQRGTWNAAGATFTPGTGAIGSGTASRITIITGSANASAGPLCPNVGGYQLDPVYLVDAKSTMEMTIRDERALVVRTESYVRKSGDWQRTGFTNYVYDYAGRLTERTASNGARYTAVYTGGLKSSETDEAGVVTDYAYDVHGRVSLRTRQGSGVIGTVTTRIVYDAAGRAKEEHVGFGQPEVLVTTRTFDDAGRMTSEAPPGNYGAVTYGYDAANRTRTTTKADGSTVTTAAYLDGKPRSTTGTGTVPKYHSYGVETAAGATSGRTWAKVNAGTEYSPRWERTWTDWLGRAVKSEQPGYTGLPNLVTESFFNPSGQLTKTTRTGYAPTLYQYNALGQVSRSGLDVNNNGSLDLTGSDRITETETYLEAHANAWWMRTDSRTYPKLGVGTAVIVSSSRTRLTQHPANRLSESQSIDAEGNVTTQVVDVNRSGRTSTATTTQTGIANATVETSVNGLSRTVTGFDQLTTTKGYDALLRASTVTDSRGNTTTTTYLAGTGLVQSVVNQHGDSAFTAYDALGRVSWTRDPKNFYTRQSYNLRGQVVRQWGDGAMPVEYDYDTTYGDRTKMSTFRGGTGWEGAVWPSGPGVADIVTWTYDGPSGLLTAKTYPAANPGSSDPALNQPKTVTQTYNVRNQTVTRTLARGVVTIYGYDEATGELLSQTYSDSTPAVGYTYGRTGQVETVADFTGTRDLVYDAAKPWRLVAEAQSAFFGNRILTRLYDETGVVGRVRGFQLGGSAGSASDLEQIFGFTTVGRLETIASKREAQAPRTFRYAYRTDAALLAALSIDGGHAFTITRSYETQRDLLTNIETKWGAAVQAGYAYAYDERAQRTARVQSGAAFADYGDVTSQRFTYNGRGELTGALGHLGADPTQPTQQLPGRQYEYDYDPAGNRLWSNRTGMTALREAYTTNKLNQYVTRENNTVPVSGTANVDGGGAGGTAVAVQLRNGQGVLTPAAAGRKGRYWGDELVVPNALAPWRGPVTVFTATRGTGGAADLFRADVRMAQAAAALQSFTHDADGNVTSDGVHDYQWDAENRLVRMATTAAALAAGFPHRVLEFRYDYLHRRVQKRVLDGGTSAEISSRRYLWDGHSLLAEFSSSVFQSFSLVRSYTWGLDIATSMSSAGGVGALLQIADHPSGKTYLPAYDGNGNVTALLNAATGAIAAAYEYSPYGELVRAQAPDPTVADNPWRFATKYWDGETGLVQHNRRFYSPGLGRFINRDPIEEAGGLNLYAYVRNNPVNKWDYLGMALTLFSNGTLSYAPGYEPGPFVGPIKKEEYDQSVGPDDGPASDSVADIPSDGSLNGFGTDTFVGGMTGSGGWMGSTTTRLLPGRGLPAGATYDDLAPGGMLSADGHDGPSVFGVIKLILSPGVKKGNVIIGNLEVIGYDEVLPDAGTRRTTTTVVLAPTTNQNGVASINANGSRGSSPTEAPNSPATDAGSLFERNSTRSGGASNPLNLPGELTGNPSKDIAHAYVWANRYMPDEMQGVPLSAYSPGSRPPGTMATTNVFNRITIDYGKMGSMAELVNAVVHEAQHHRQNFFEFTFSRHSAGDSIYQIGESAQSRYVIWQLNPQPPPPPKSGGSSP